MYFKVSREALLRPLQCVVSGVIEKRQTVPIYSNILLEVFDDQLRISGSDSSMELVATVTVLESTQTQSGKITIPGKKILDIFRVFTESSEVEFHLKQDGMHIHSCGSHFVLSTLPAEQFPALNQLDFDTEVEIKKDLLKKAIEYTSFSIAPVDFYSVLNGMLLEFKADQFRTVATDGHRLALFHESLQTNSQEGTVVVPRKGIMSLIKLFSESNKEVDTMLCLIGKRHFQVHFDNFKLTSSVLVGTFPDYNAVLNKIGHSVLTGHREQLKELFQRISVLSHDKYRSIQLILNKHNLQVISKTPEQELAEEAMEVNYQGKQIEMRFNVNYLLDVCSTFRSESIRMIFSDKNSSVLFEEDTDERKAMCVVMPMRL